MLPAQQKDLFGHSNQGENYDKFRPVYPKEFFEVIMKNTANHGNYLDVACGTGQLLFDLEKEFKFSLGIDISPKQIEVTQQKIIKNNLKDRVQALVCDAHSLAEVAQAKGIPSQFDLITIGQALHWFDTQAFFQQVSQHLMHQQTESVFAVTGYFCRGFDFILNETEVEQDKYIYDEFYAAVKDHFDCDRENLSLAYAGYDFSKHFKEIVDSTETVTYTPCTVFEMTKYLKTYSAYNTMLEKNKNNLAFADPIQKFEQDILQRIAQIQNNTQVSLNLPIRMKTSYFLRIFKRLC